MKKFTFFVAALCATMMASAATTTLTMSDFKAVTGSKNGIEFTLDKGEGSSAPVYNETAGDLRAYANNTITIKCTENMTSISFEVSKKGQYRLAPLTATTGTCEVKGKPDFTAVWNGSANEVVITVGAKADYGTDGNTKAGQLCFNSFTVTTGEGGETGETGETGDVIEIKDLVYATAVWDADPGYLYWMFDLYKDYDSETENVSYPEVIFSVTGGTATTIADDDICFVEDDDFGFYVKAEGDTIEFVKGDIDITAIGEGNYVFNCTFEDADGQKYTFNTTVNVFAYEYNSEEEIELTDVASTAIRQVEMMSDVYAHDGRIYAEEGARIYTVTGLDVTRMNGNLDGIYVVKNDNKVAKVVVRR